MKRFFRNFKNWKWFLPISVVALLVFSYYLMVNSIPDNIHIVTGKEQTFTFGLPLIGEVDNSQVEVFTNKKEKLNKDKLHLSETFSLKSDEQGDFSISCKLFGVFSVKKVNVEVMDATKVIPGGTAVGIYVKSDGILVLGTGTVNAADGSKQEPALKIVKSGDYITAVNGEKIDEKEDLIQKVNDGGKKTVTLTLRRGKSEIKKKVKPVQTGKSEYRLGIWVRDDIAGIGMLTYVTPEGKFGALGHCVSDIDTGETMSLADGSLYKSLITGINKGKKGDPGELMGLITYKEDNRLATIEKNTGEGIFGTMDALPPNLKNSEYVSLGMKEEIKRGKASIICDVSGTRKEYDIMITDVNYADKTGNKGITIEVTDPELIKLTGGIVQGMSGSPIMQNHRLVGAVTHVFIQNPRKGYGAFIENMMAE